MKVTLHNHTIYSYDCLLEFRHYLAVLKKKKIDAIAITDHNNTDALKKWKREFESNGIELIPGVEVSSGDGHVIGLFIENNIKRGLSVQETVGKIKEQGGLAVAPHPFDIFRYGIGKEIFNSKFDCIEVFNSRSMYKRGDKKSQEVGRKLSLVGICGSDAHTIEEIGNSYIETSEGDLFNAIKKGRFKNHGKYSSPNVHFTTFFDKIKKNFS